MFVWPAAVEHPEGYDIHWMKINAEPVNLKHTLQIEGLRPNLDVFVEEKPIAECKTNTTNNNNNMGQHQQSILATPS